MSLPATSPSETHQCRIFLTGRDPLTEKPMYTEVWDTVEREHPPTDLPKGNPLVICTGPSSEKVREQIDAIMLEREMHLVGDWGSRGGI